MVKVSFKRRNCELIYFIIQVNLIFIANLYKTIEDLKNVIITLAGENGYTCEICGKAFNRRTRLDLHVKYVHEGAKPFDCEKCGKSFIRKEDLARHEILHSGVKGNSLFFRVLPKKKKKKT